MHEDWIARWREGRIGFHEGRPNALLERHVARFGDRRRVIVPLCGRTEDMAFLAAQGLEVVGVELAEQAVREFFELRGIVPEVAEHGPFVAYRAGAITLLAGDWFATTREQVGPVDAAYDRGALIALPPELRPRYVAHLRSLLPAGAPVVVITVEYDQALMAGPPFAVLEPALRALYAGCEVELLEERPAPPGGKCSQSGIEATERCFAVVSAGG
jgi:thiopurine S-methyltransferase